MYLKSEIKKLCQNRIIGLDMLRAFAILTVIYQHGGILLPVSITKYYYLISPIDGVSVFFVLSGFLIAGILIKIIEATTFSYKDLYNFWGRRWFRTLPNYFLILIILLCYQFFILKTTEEFNITYLFFLQNFYSPHPDFFPEAWSLSVEECFYILFPLLLFVISKVVTNKQKFILVGIVLFLTVPLLLRIIQHIQLTDFKINLSYLDWDTHLRKITIYRLDSIMYGVLGAYIKRYHANVWLYKKVGVYLSILFLFCFIYLKYTSSFSILSNSVNSILSFNIESLIVLSLLPFFSELKDIKYKRLAIFISFISIISYSMYLINLTLVQNRLFPVIMGLFPSLLDFQYLYLTKYFFYWFFVLTGSSVIYIFFEKPTTNLREKFFSK